MDFFYNILVKMIYKVVNRNQVQILNTKDKLTYEKLVEFVRTKFKKLPPKYQVVFRNNNDQIIVITNDETLDQVCNSGDGKIKFDVNEIANDQKLEKVEKTEAEDVKQIKKQKSQIQVKQEESTPTPEVKIQQKVETQAKKQQNEQNKEPSTGGRRIPERFRQKSNQAQTGAQEVKSQQQATPLEKKEQKKQIPPVATSNQSVPTENKKVDNQKKVEAIPTTSSSNSNPSLNKPNPLNNNPLLNRQPPKSNPLMDDPLASRSRNNPLNSNPLNSNPLNSNPLNSNPLMRNPMQSSSSNSMMSQNRFQQESSSQDPRLAMLRNANNPDPSELSRRILSSKPNPEVPARQRQMKQNDDVLIHASITCDECRKTPIVGVRYKCTQCPDYDLCEQCQQKSQHSVKHIFLKINKHEFTPSVVITFKNQQTDQEQRMKRQKEIDSTIKDYEGYVDKTREICEFFKDSDSYNRRFIQFVYRVVSQNPGVTTQQATEKIFETLMANAENNA